MSEAWLVLSLYLKAKIMNHWSLISDPFWPLSPYSFALLGTFGMSPTALNAPSISFSYVIPLIGFKEGFLLVLDYVLTWSSHGNILYGICLNGLVPITNPFPLLCMNSPSPSPFGLLSSILCLSSQTPSKQRSKK